MSVCSHFINMTFYHGCAIFQITKNLSKRKDGCHSIRFWRKYLDFTVLLLKINFASEWVFKKDHPSSITYRTGHESLIPLIRAQNLSSKKALWVFFMGFFLYVGVLCSFQSIQKRVCFLLRQNCRQRKCDRHLIFAGSTSLSNYIYFVQTKGTAENLECREEAKKKKKRKKKLITMG